MNDLLDEEHAVQYPTPAKIVMSSSGGWYVSTPVQLDRVIDEYLPNSVAGLRMIVAERVGVPTTDYDYVTTISEFLLILADMEVA